MNVLVTGAGGFIGSHVVRELLARGHTVHAIVRPAASLDRLGDVLERIRVWPVDLLDGPAVDAAMAAIGPEAVVHLAWYAEPGRYLRDGPRNLMSLEAGVRLVRTLAAAGTTRRLVLVGTCLEYVAGPGGTADPVYAATKRALHGVAMAMTGADSGGAGLRVACAHLFSVFGPGEDPRRGIPSVIRSLVAGEPVDLGAGTQRRDYVFVADVAAALVTVLESDVVGTVDVCTGEARPLRQVFEEVGRAAGAGHLLRFGTRPVTADEAFDAEGDPATLHRLGWRPGDTFAGRMDETVAWWRARLPMAAAMGSAT